MLGIDAYITKAELTQGIYRQSGGQPIISVVIGMHQIVEKYTEIRLGLWHEFGRFAEAVRYVSCSSLERVHKGTGHLLRISDAGFVPMPFPEKGCP